MSDASEPAEAATGEGADRLVEVNGLRTYYESGGLLSSTPVKAVDGVDLHIERGETLGLVGESGCGKTTLGRTLVQLEDATAGEVLFDGRDITRLRGAELKEWRKNAQMVFQDPESSLNDRMTVGEIIREPLDVHGVGTPRERRDRVRELLRTVGLQEEHYYRYPHQFSGGQRQRVGIARALALSPEFVVLDEPVSALDVSVQAKVLNLLEDLQAEFDLTYLFIAHDLSVVRHICDRVAVMYLGHVMEVGDTEELFEDPKNPYTYSLLSAIPDTDPTAEKRRVTLRGTPPSPRFPPAGCPFSTRCPVKIRPPAHRDVDDDVWEGIEVFRDILRERERAEKSLAERAREVLGLETRFSDVDEILGEVFDGTPGRSAPDGEGGGSDPVASLPESVRPTVREAVDAARSGDEARARRVLAEAFGSDCDAAKPDHNPVSETGRVSLCHRHLAEHEEPEPVFERLLGGVPGEQREGDAGTLADVDDRP
ncbi:MAG: ABC transporter ATP-binding protein [Haloarculaceae archaeon]